MAMKANAVKVLNYLKENPTVDVTAADLANILGLEKRQVDGIFTSAIQRKGYGERVEAEVMGDDGLHKRVKLLKLTPEGMTYEPLVED